MKKIEEIEEIEEIMEEIPIGWKQELKAFYKEHLEIQEIWNRIKDNILPALYAEIRNKKEIDYYLEFRETDEKLMCALYQIGEGNLEKSPEKAIFKRLIISSSVHITTDVLEQVLQFALLKIVQDNQIYIPEIPTDKILSITLFNNFSILGHIRDSRTGRSTRLLNTTISKYII